MSFLDTSGAHQGDVRGVQGARTPLNQMSHPWPRLLALEEPLLHMKDRSNTAHVTQHDAHAASARAALRMSSQYFWRGIQSYSCEQGHQVLPRALAACHQAPPPC